MRRFPFLDTLLQDFRFAVRVLRKSPGFTVVAVLTLALGIGVNTTVFTAYNTVALKPLALRDPGAVVRVQRQFDSGKLGNVQYGLSYPEYAFLRDHNEVFTALTANSWPAGYTARVGGGDPERWTTGLVSGNYFSDLGVGAALGRSIVPDDDRPGAAQPVLTLSYGFWQRRFNGDPLVLGQAVRLNGIAFQIAGVVPADFGGSNVPPQTPDVWAPLQMIPALTAGRDPLSDPAQAFVQVLGRLKPDVSPARAAQATLLALNQFDQPLPKTEDRPVDKTVAIKLPAATFFGNTDDIRFQASFFAVLGLVSSVLLIGCANLANMLMARAAGRQREFAVRLAMGAGRGRLVRQLLTESVVIGLLGGVGGVLLSAWSCSVLSALVEQLAATFGLAGSVTMDVRPDIRVFAYALGVSLIAGIGFGLLPALRFSRPDLNLALKNEGSTLGKKLGGSRVRGLLLAGQAAASILLLICAGLLARGLVRSRVARPGFETDNAYALSLDYGSDKAHALALQRALVERLAAMPDLRGVTLSDRIPMMGTWTPRVIAPPTRPGMPVIRARAGANRVAPEFFATLGVPLVDGRNFTAQECSSDAAVAIVSQAAAQMLWPGESAVGKRAKLDLNFRGDWHEFEIVGVARDARNANLSRIDPAFFYLPVKASEVNNILFSTRGGSAAVGAVRAAVERVAPEALPSLTLINLEKVPLRIQRLLAQLSAAFAATLAGLALLLAAVGIYGVMNYLVSQRVKEIGIRMALGANARGVAWLVVRQGLRPVLIGSSVGMVAAAALSWVLRMQLQFPGAPDMLYGVSAFDPLTYGGLALFLALVAVSASWIPARRAARVDPMVALRYE
jgi:predicted permease